MEGKPENGSSYNAKIEDFREREYPMLQDNIYLDHAGATLCSKSLMTAFADDMMSSLYGNPHSASGSSQLTTRKIEDVRLRVLQFFKADPREFDVVFVANATAGAKLVMESFRSADDGFTYGYHKDSHTSLVGIRETAVSSRCFTNDDVRDWLSDLHPFQQGYEDVTNGLFAYPAQSNMDGHRLPSSWPTAIRQLNRRLGQNTYTLLDAAALASTSQVDLSNADTAPDFMIVSFYKIFGFPDLGALFVRMASGDLLRRRKYFGGGTVDTVVCIKEQWHAPKKVLHESLEDGTLPFHNILALDTAMVIQKRLFESMDRISKHTIFLAKCLYSALESLRHANGEKVCRIYARKEAFNGQGHEQGPVVAFNLKNIFGAWLSNTEVEKLASVRGIHIRTGGVCNPGGIATAVGLEPWEMRRNFSAGYRCGIDDDIMGGKPTGVIRASFGAMSTISDVTRFIEFIKEFFVEKSPPIIVPPSVQAETEADKLFVESLAIYPIKSCAAFNIGPDVDWEIRPEGLLWDREWCLIHRGTGQALSQKRHPRMALIRPTLDFEMGLLRVKYHGPIPDESPTEICISLSSDPSYYQPSNELLCQASRVCGDVIFAHTYASDIVNGFFTKILGVPCALARFPAGGTGVNTRHSKAHMQNHQRQRASALTAMSESAPQTITPPDSDTESSRPILLSNESPILAITRASLDALNREIIKTGGKAAKPSVFRANIVIASSGATERNQPYCEDHWSSIRIGQQDFDMLGSCRRCYMICVDQETAVKDEEPFVTLAKTRRFDGKVFFGSHMGHKSSSLPTLERQHPTIQVGDAVRVNM